MTPDPEVIARAAREATMDAHNPLITDDEAREYRDAKALADRAMNLSRIYGKPSVTLHGQIYGQREKYQGLSLLLTAARVLLSDADSPVDDMLNFTERLIRCDCDAHQREAELWEAINEVSAKAALEAWERA